MIGSLTKKKFRRDKIIIIPDTVLNEFSSDILMVPPRRTIIPKAAPIRVPSDAKAAADPRDSFFT